MSDMFWFDVYIWHYAWSFDPRGILQPILDLEAATPHTKIKPATPFKHTALKGFWHQHFFSSHFLVKNINEALGKNGMKKLVDEIFDPKKSSIITREMINELSQRVVTEPFEQRQRDNKVTGEWIIFTKHGGKNYYLALNKHAADKAGDQFIYDRIVQH
jgi:hypothetical protein